MSCIATAVSSTRCILKARDPGEAARKSLMSFWAGRLEDLGELHAGGGHIYRGVQLQRSGVELAMKLARFLQDPRAKLRMCVEKGVVIW